MDQKKREKFLKALEGCFSDCAATAVPLEEMRQRVQSAKKLVGFLETLATQASGANFDAWSRLLAQAKKQGAKEVVACARSNQRDFYVFIGDRSGALLETVIREEEPHCKVLFSALRQGDEAVLDCLVEVLEVLDRSTFVILKRNLYEYSEDAEGWVKVA